MTVIHIIEDVNQISVTGIRLTRHAASRSALVGVRALRAGPARGRTRSLRAWRGAVELRKAERARGAWRGAVELRKAERARVAREGRTQES